MIKTLIDFFKESKDASKERLKLSIVPVYLTILILYYWKPLSIYIFSEKNIEDKIKQIDLFYVGENSYNHLCNLLFVLIISLVSSLIFPLLMLIIDFILRKPNSERKIIKNKSKDIDRNEDLKITKHKYEINKILSGNKEVEDYNKSIEDLKTSYEDRILNLETINTQKDKNLSKQIENLTNENNQLQFKLNEISETNNQLKLRNDNLRINEFELTKFSKFNRIFDKKEIFKTCCAFSTN